MSKAITITQSAEVRKKIQASQLANRLQSHAFGEVEMSTTQVTAARVLLAKTVPDLSSVELTGDPDKPIHHAIVATDQDIINRYMTKMRNK